MLGLACRAVGLVRSSLVAASATCYGTAAKLTSAAPTFATGVSGALLHAIRAQSRTLTSCASRKFGQMPTPLWASDKIMGGMQSSLSSLPKLTQVHSVQVQPVRTRVYYSWRQGTAKSVTSVTERFYRLASGLWIRTRAGRHKRLWSKRLSRRKRLLMHVFCNKQQCRLLDKMTGSYWKRPRHFPEDPYAPYQQRVGFDSYVYSPPKFLP